MKRVLCFGDSNTFGFNPENGTRYDKNSRWTGILQSLVGSSIRITEAGCNNRTCFQNNPAGKMFIGCKILPELLLHDFDCIILGLGVNDLQKIYNTTLDDVKSGIENLINIVKIRLPNSKIILTSPSVLTEKLFGTMFGELFDLTSIEKSKQFAKIYKDVAENKECYFLDLNLIAEVSEIDGVHYTAESHQLIAKEVFEMLNQIF